MKKKAILSLVILISFWQLGLTQTPAEVYRKPLRDVLSEIEKRFDINVSYSDNLVSGVMVQYPTWRYRVDIEETLSNILLPLDMVFTKTGEKEYEISKYAYHIRPVEEGRKHLDQLLSICNDVTAWEKRKAELRDCILKQIGLFPFPVRTPLNPIYTPKRRMNGYTVENVAIETIPGVYLCGSLYKPSKGRGPFPAILSPHGHFNTADTNEYGRYRPEQQYRCAMLARMGAIVFSYEMFAWGESRLQVDGNLHRTGLALTMQTINSVRVIDFLCSLPNVDPDRIAVTGESGGGTQSFLITAIDDRISVSVPVVMVSSFFYGGCPCESGLPLHSCTSVGTNNAEIAAMASPRPMLVISDGNDWTREVPTLEFPYLQKIYALYDKTGNVENVHLEKEGHDYGPSKRYAMYDFIVCHIGLNPGRFRDESGKYDESGVTIEKYDAQLVFGRQGILPTQAVRGEKAIRDVLKSLQ